MAGEILIFGGLLLDRYFSIENGPCEGRMAILPERPLLSEAVR